MVWSPTCSRLYESILTGQHVRRGMSTIEGRRSGKRCRRRIPRIGLSSPRTYLIASRNQEARRRLFSLNRRRPEVVHAAFIDILSAVVSVGLSCLVIRRSMEGECQCKTRPGSGGPTRAPRHLLSGHHEAKQTAPKTSPICHQASNPEDVSLS